MSEATAASLAADGTAAVVRLPLVGSDAVGQVLATVGRADAATAAALHVGSETRPYACRRAGPWLDVASLHAGVTRALLAGGEGATLVAWMPLAEALGGGGGPVLRVRFRAPTRFREAGRDYLFPDPAAVFGDLLRRWTALGLAPMPAPNPRRIAGKIDTYRVAIGPGPRGRPLAGFVGEASYDLTGLNAADRWTVWRLARFAAWRGVGAHTGYGFGWVEVA